MKRIVFLSTLFLLSPFFTACAPTEYNISIIKKENEEEPDANFTYTTNMPKPRAGNDFYVYFKPDKYYDIFNNDIEVLVNNVPFQELDRFWKYNQSTHTLKIWGEIVTGNIKISVMPDVGQYNYYVYVNKWSTNPAPISGNDYVYCEVNKNVSEGFADITINDEDFDEKYIDAPDWLEYKFENKKLIINNDQFYRDITITLKDK